MTTTTQLAQMLATMPIGSLTDTRTLSHGVAQVVLDDPAFDGIRPIAPLRKDADEWDCNQYRFKYSIWRHRIGDRLCAYLDGQEVIAP